LSSGGVALVGVQVCILLVSLTARPEKAQQLDFSGPPGPESRS
jgi:hypothetical protein